MDPIRILKGLMTGAVVGGILAVIAGGAFGSVMGSLASVASLGDATKVRAETVKWAMYGAVAGVTLGAIAGGIVTVGLRKLNGFIVGATVGAVILALAGFIFGSIRSGGEPVNTARVIVMSVAGVIIGSLVGGFLGWIITPSARLLR